MILLIIPIKYFYNIPIIFSVEAKDIDREGDAAHKITKSASVSTYQYPLDQESSSPFYTKSD